MERTNEEWRLRYRELERTLEQIIVRASSMSANELQESANFHIEKLVNAQTFGVAHLVCVASGANLEYGFRLLKDREVIEDIPFQRINSIPIPYLQSAGADSCEVLVKCNKGTSRGRILSKEVEI